MCTHTPYLESIAMYVYLKPKSHRKDAMKDLPILVNYYFYPTYLVAM